MNLEKLMEHIIIIPDYRQSWKVEHKLSDILLLTICAANSLKTGSDPRALPDYVALRDEMLKLSVHMATYKETWHFGGMSTGSHSGTV